jgi:acetolactate synthase-1/2/3 large subunit
MPKLYTGAEIVFKCLEEQKVNHIFGYPGGAVLPIYDELKNHTSIKHILVRHEQGAGHAAEGYARSSGKPGVVLVTSGPGATNVVTCINRCLHGLGSISLYFRTSANSFNRNGCVSRM